MKKTGATPPPNSSTTNSKKEWDQWSSVTCIHSPGRAWRRPLAGRREGQACQLYQQAVANGLDRESAAREVIVRVLVSPNFLFKAEPRPANVAAAGTGARRPALRLGAGLAPELLSLVVACPIGNSRKAAADG